MKLIGLCGQSGSGKSALCAELVKRGVVCIDCDEITKSVQKKGSACVAELAAAFGRGILLPDGSLDRRRTARIAFADPEKTALLNRITHRYVLEALKNKLKEYQAEPFVVVEAPTLFESGLDQACDYRVGLVSKSSEERIVARDRLSKTAARERLARQQTEAFLRAHCELILENDGDLSALSELAEDLIRTVRTEVCHEDLD